MATDHQNHIGYPYGQRPAKIKAARKPGTASKEALSQASRIMNQRIKQIRQKKRGS